MTTTPEAFEVVIRPTGGFIFAVDRKTGHQLNRAPAGQVDKLIGAVGRQLKAIGYSADTPVRFYRHVPKTIRPKLGVGFEEIINDPEPLPSLDATVAALIGA